MHAPVAQGIEQFPSKEKVAGSIPARCTTKEKSNFVGSPRFARRFNCKEFWAKKSIGGFELVKENFLKIIIN